MTLISAKVRLVSPATPSRAASRSTTSALASRCADFYEPHAGEMQGSTWPVDANAVQQFACTVNVQMVTGKADMLATSVASPMRATYSAGS